VFWRKDKARETWHKRALFINLAVTKVVFETVPLKKPKRPKKPKRVV